MPQTMVKKALGKPSLELKPQLLQKKILSQFSGWV